MVGLDLRDRLKEVVEACRVLTSKGWMPATSGNVSVRLSGELIAVTPSGKRKDMISEEDLVVVDMEGRVVSGGKPSAETLIHIAIYKVRPDARAVVHAHTPASTVVSRVIGDRVLLEGYELLKAFESVNTHETTLEVPVFPNDQNMERLSSVIVDHLKGAEGVRAFLLSSHGVYTWASCMDKALTQLEALEFLLECELRLMTFKT